MESPSETPRKHVFSVACDPLTACTTGPWTEIGPLRPRGQPGSGCVYFDLHWKTRPVAKAATASKRPLPKAARPRQRNGLTKTRVHVQATQHPADDPKASPAACGSHFLMIGLSLQPSVLAPKVRRAMISWSQDSSWTCLARQAPTSAPRLTKSMLSAQSLSWAAGKQCQASTQKRQCCQA